MQPTLTVSLAISEQVSFPATAGSRGVVNHSSGALAIDRF